MEIPQSLRDAVIASLSGEIPVTCGNASIEAIVTMDPDEAPTDLMLQKAADWMEFQHGLQRDADALVEELSERWPVPNIGAGEPPNFPPYFSENWWFIIRYYPWSNELVEAIEAGNEWLTKRTPPA